MNFSNANCLIFLGISGVVWVVVQAKWGWVWEGTGTSLDAKIEALNADQRMLRFFQDARRTLSNAKLKRELDALEEGDREKEREATRKKERGF